MKEYLLCILTLAIACTLVTALSPEGEGGGLKRHVGMICALCLLCVVLKPIINFNWDFDFSDIEQSDREEYESIFENTVNESLSQGKAQGIYDVLSGKFGIEREECYVSVQLDRDGKPERVFIRLFGSAVWKNTNEIKEYISRLCKCETVIAIG